MPASRKIDQVAAASGLILAASSRTIVGSYVRQPWRTGLGLSVQRAEGPPGGRAAERRWQRGAKGACLPPPAMCHEMSGSSTRTVWLLNEECVIVRTTNYCHPRLHHKSRPL